MFPAYPHNSKRHPERNAVESKDLVHHQIKTLRYRYTQATTCKLKTKRTNSEKS